MVSFFSEVLRKTPIPRSATVLVVCGGLFDRDVLLDAAFTQVTISNLDERVTGDEFSPFQWSLQDAEDLSFPDGSFDYVMVHAGLHHCYSPHRALLEMYRVAAKGILVVEARDSLLMRLSIGAGRVPAFEAAAVRANGFRYGGVRNSSIPNHIYRWTEREVEKTVASYAPQAAHAITFHYGLRIPTERIPLWGSSSFSWIARGLEGTIRLIAHTWRRQGNQFCFFVEKPSPSQLFPWMKSFTEFDKEYKGL